MLLQVTLQQATTAKRVLVVDDNRDMVETFLALLEFSGHKGLGRNSAVDIVACVEEFDPDVVVMDLAMPVKDGLAAAREIRAAAPGNRPLLIACTGERFDDDGKTIAKKHGFNFYLKKPCDTKVLLALIANAPGRPA